MCTTFGLSVIVGKIGEKVAPLGSQVRKQIFAMLNIAYAHNMFLRLLCSVVITLIAFQASE